MSKLKALVIDDEPDQTTYLSAVLRDHGWEARTANSAAEGLAMAQAEVPDVVLLDVMMPERGGLSVCLALRKDPRTLTVPVVLVTGIQDELTHDFGNFLDRFKTLRPAGYVEKPVDPQRLLEILDEVCASPAARDPQSRKT